MAKNEDPDALLKKAEDLLALQIRVFGLDGGPITNAREDVAERLENLGRFIEARPLPAEVLAARRRHLGDEDPETLSAEEWPGWNLAKEGLREGGRPLFQHVLEVRLRTLGPEHEDTRPHNGCLRLSAL
jgi:Tetratricopeptide repeat